MKNAYKIAGFGLLTGAAVMLATAGAATAHGRMGGFDGPGGPGGFGGFGGFGARGGILAASFADLDTDGSGMITEEDLAARGEARFAEADTDGDGKITAAELETAIGARIAADIAARTESDKTATAEGTPPQPQRPGRSDRTMPANMAQHIAARIIDRLDTETDGARDGALTLAEMTPSAAMAPGRVIDRFDTDDDNAISEAEFDAAKAEFGDRMAKRGDRADRDDRGGWGGHKGGRHDGGRR